jgi:signal peptidase I
MERSIKLLAGAVALLARALVVFTIVIALAQQRPAAEIGGSPTPTPGGGAALGCDAPDALLYRMEQESMRTTIEPNDRLLLQPGVPEGGFEHGDIIAFYPVLDGAGSSEVPGSLTPYLKRVIGLPFDLVELRDGVVYVNGQALAEPYVHDAATLPLGGKTEWAVDADRLFVLGDNRQNSTDSRSDQIGQIATRYVIGRAVYICSPEDRVGPLR